MADHDSVCRHVVQVNAAWDADVTTPEALLERHDALGAWGAALLGAGLERATVVQRFTRAAELTRDGVRFLFVRDGHAPRPRPWQRLPRLAAAVRACGADVVHVNGLLFPGAVWELRRLLPRTTALVVQDHAGGGPPHGLLRRALWRWGLGGAGAFWFSAPEPAHAWRRARILAPRARLDWLPEASRAITPPPYAEAREACRLRGDPALLWVGHLDSNQDPLTVVEGFAGALAHLPRAVLTFVFRGGEQRRALQACLAAAPVLRAHLELRGSAERDELPAFHGAADLFVLGSRREDAGLSLLEALACGALPVVTDIPAFRALTAGGTLGAPDRVPPLLWRPGDPAAFRTALLRAAPLVCGSPDERAATRALVRAHFERELSWPAVAARARAAYEAVCAERRAATH